MIDIKKTYTTRSGLPVRIYATDGGGSRPVHGAFFDGGRWRHSTWSDGGRFTCELSDQPCDIIEVKPKRMLDVWIAIHKNGSISMYERMEQAIYHTDNVIARLHIVREYTEGEGIQP